MEKYSDNVSRYPAFPAFASVDGPAVFSDYQYEMLYQQCDILNRKIAKALYEPLPDSQKQEMRDDNGRLILIPSDLGIKEDSIVRVVIDAETFDVLNVLLAGVDDDDVFPLRRVDYAMDCLEKHVPEDIWLEGLPAADRTAVRNAISKGATNIPLGVAVERYAPLLWRIDVIRRVGMLPTYDYGSFGISMQTTCYRGRNVVELIYSVCREDGPYEIPLGMWPVSCYESRILDFFDELSKRMTPEAEKILRNRIEVIADFLKGQAKVIHDYEFTRYHALARERFPKASDEDIFKALCSLSDSEYLLKNPPLINHLIAPWRK